jgi:hypothetical protein
MKYRGKKAIRLSGLAAYSNADVAGRMDRFFAALNAVGTRPGNPG